MYESEIYMCSGQIMVQEFNLLRDTTDRKFIIKKTNDEDQTFETIVSNKQIICIHVYICICLFVSIRGQPQ